MAEFVLADPAGVRVIAGVPGEATLLDAENLPSGLFDLTSGDAGEVLQKLRSYGGIRLAEP